MIALVITVIILLILAAVAMSLITGQNGLFARANHAGDEYYKSAQAEAVSYNTMQDYLELYDGGSSANTSDEDDIEAIVAAQYGGLATASEINTDLFLYQTLTQPSGKNKGTARITDINWNYFFPDLTIDEDGFALVGYEYVTSLDYNPECEYGDYEEDFSTIGQQIDKLVIPYEVEIDSAKYTITSLSLPRFYNNWWLGRDSADDRTEFAAGSSENATEKFSYLIIPSSITEIRKLYG